MRRRDFSKRTLLLGLGASATPGRLRGSEASEDTYEEPPKKLPVRRFDVVVAGGGTAGVFGALAAARQGARTILIESKGYCGGTATEGGTAIHSFYNLWARARPPAPPPPCAPRRSWARGSCRTPCCATP